MQLLVGLRLCIKVTTSRECSDVQGAIKEVAHCSFPGVNHYTHLFLRKTVTITFLITASCAKNGSYHSVALLLFVKLVGVNGKA